MVSFGDKLDIMIRLNQDTMDRHLGLMKSGSAVLYNGDKIKPGEATAGVQLCPFSVKELAPKVRGDLVQNTIALAAVMQLIGVEFQILEDILSVQFKRKGQDVIDENVGVARAGFDYAAAHFKPFAFSLPTRKKTGVLRRQRGAGDGRRSGGCEILLCLSDEPSSGVLHWMARHARELGIMVRQVEDEIGVANMASAPPTQVPGHVRDFGRWLCVDDRSARRGGDDGNPAVCINVQRAGPATGVPTKTEQGDLWQVMGAGQGDYQRIIVAPTEYLDCFNTVPELFNLVDKFQCPGIVLSDLLLSEGRSSVDPAELDLNVHRQ